MILQLPIRRTSLPTSSLSNFTWGNWNPLQHTSHHFLHRFQYFVLPHSTTSNHEYWIYQIIYKAKPIKLVIKLYIDHDTWWVKHATHQKAASPSNLDNMVNNSSNFNTKYAEFLQMIGATSFSQSILWIEPTLQALPRNSSSSSVNFHFPISPLLVQKIILTIPTNTPFIYNSAIFHLPLFAYNHRNNLHQKYFPCVKHSLPIKAASRKQGVMEYCENWHCFNLSLLPQSMDSDSRAHSQSLILYRWDS